MAKKPPTLTPGSNCPCGKPLPWDILSGFDGIRTHSELDHLCSNCGRRFHAGQGQVTIVEDHCTLCEGDQFLPDPRRPCPRCNGDNTVEPPVPLHYWGWSPDGHARRCGAKDGPCASSAQTTTCPACLDALAKQLQGAI